MLSTVSPHQSSPMISPVRPGKLTASVLDVTDQNVSRSTTGSSNSGDGSSEGSETGVHSVHLQGDGPCEEERLGGQSMYSGRCLPKLLTDSVVGRLTINVLPDVVFLEIFDFYRKESKDPAVRTPIVWYSPSWRWKELVQVCRKWRHIIFGSPRRLDLRVVCTKTTSTTSLDIWPFALIDIICFPPYTVNEEGVANVIAVVERHD